MKDRRNKYKAPRKTTRVRTITVTPARPIHEAFIFFTSSVLRYSNGYSKYYIQNKRGYSSSSGPGNLPLDLDYKL